MRWSIKIYGLIVYGLFVSKPSSSDCGNEILSDPYGVVIGYNDKFNEINCTWSFSLPDNRTSYMLILKVTTYIQYQSRYFRSSISLPDGSGHDIPRRSEYLRSKPWCGIYVKNTSKNELSCQPGATLPSVCNAPATVSLSWPPKLSTSFYKFYMYLHYEYLECPKDHIIVSSLPSTASPSVKETTWTETATHFNVTTATISTQAIPWRLRKTLQTTLGIAISLAIFLLVAIIVITVLGYRYRYLKSVEQDRKNAIKSDQDQVTTARHVDNEMAANNIYAAVDNAERTAVRYKVDVGTDDQNTPVSIELYAMAEQEDHAEKQDIDNVLYGNGERQSVHNEIYRM